MNDPSYDTIYITVVTELDPRSSQALISFRVWLEQPLGNF